MANRILHVIASMRWSAAQRQLQCIVDNRSSSSFQHRVCVLRSDNGREGTPNDADTEFLSFAQRLDLSAIRRFRRRIQDYDPAIVHAWGTDSFAVVAAAVSGLRYRWIGSEFADLKQDQEQPWWTHLVRRTCKISLLPEWLRPTTFGTKSAVHVVDYGVDATAGRSCRQAKRDDICGRLKIPTDAKIVGFVGDFLRENRLKDAIWAADLLKVVREDVHLVLAGSGPHLPRLARFRRQVQIRDRVHFVLDPAAVNDALTALDFCWITSETDRGIPTMLEAMARGIPVIASDTLAHRRVLRPEQPGQLFPVGHRAGLARLTLRLLENPQSAEAMRRTALAQLGSQHSAHHVAQTYDRFYKKLSSNACWASR